ncbi:beta-lactamase-like protein [Chytriomyces sp. MP71]|nr:beta-lactamase-like protein [Chytriomyces sp. MP71]
MKTGHKRIEFIFLGTGPSNTTPDVGCLTARPQPTCKVCLLAADSAGPSDPRYASPSYSREPKRSHPSVPAQPLPNKNRRNNTSALYRYTHSDGRTRNILIDCGKSFYESAKTWFTHYDIRTIDAILITHDHADAMGGLDDLRVWTYCDPAVKVIVQASIPIYVSAATMDVVARAFPYLVNKASATGGGSIPTLDFRVYDALHPGTGELVHNWFVHRRSPDGFLQLSIEELDVIVFPVQHGFAGSNPYFSTGFVFPGLTYISDASAIPEASRKLIQSFNAGESGMRQILVLDCLREADWASHFGYHSAIKETLLLNPRQVYFTGLNHELEHEEFGRILKTHEGLKSVGIPGHVACDGLLLSFQI